MLLKELILELQKFNLDSNIVFHCSIESGRSVSICEGGSVTLGFDERNDEVFL